MAELATAALVLVSTEADTVVAWVNKMADQLARCKVLDCMLQVAAVMMADCNHTAFVVAEVNM